MDRAYIGEILQRHRDEGSLVLDLGLDHWATFWTRTGADHSCGVQIYHKAPDGDWCIGSVCWDPGPWRLIQLEPLHFEDSVACGGAPPGWMCGDHGWVRDGKWVPAG